MELTDLQSELFQDPVLSKLSKRVKRERIPFFLVGGYLRDLCLGKGRGDYDFVLPEKDSSFLSAIEEVLQVHFFRVGKETGTSSFRVTGQGLSLDVTFFQGQTIEEDLKRRDFTINTIAFSLLDETWHWAEGALEDMRNRRVRAVSDRSIDLDPLRMLRAIRYACVLPDFSIEKSLQEEIASKRGLILKIPAERVKAELDRILLSPRQNNGVKALHETGLLMTLFPELRGLEDLGQDEHHHLNALPHTLLALEKIPWVIERLMSKGREVFLSQEDLASLSYALLFHDIGKQNTYSKDEGGKVHFYRHEDFSCQAAEGVMKRLRFSNLEQERVLCLIRNHMRILNLSRATGEPALKRLVHQLGKETILLVLHTIADKEASRGPLSCQKDEGMEDLCLHLLELFAQQEIIHPPPLVDGRDVMALGYCPGPRIGQILSLIRRKQVEGEIKTREEALRVIRDEFTFQ